MDNKVTRELLDKLRGAGDTATYRLAGGDPMNPKPQDAFTPSEDNDQDQLASSANASNRLKTLENVFAKNPYPTNPLLDVMRGINGLKQEPIRTSNPKLDNSSSALMDALIAQSSQKPTEAPVVDSGPVSKTSVKRTPASTTVKQDTAQAQIAPGQQSVYSSTDMLKAAHLAANQNSLANNLLHAGESFSNAIARRPDAKSVLDSLGAGVNTPVEQFDQLQKTKKSDLEMQKELSKAKDEQMSSNAQSPISDAARQVLRRAGLKIPDTFTAAQLQANPILERLLGTLESQNLRKAMMNEKNDTKKGAQYDTNLQKAAAAIKTVRGQKALGNSYEAERLADNALSLIEPYKNDLNNVPAPILNLFKDEMGKIATGGVATKAGAEGILPSTAASKLAEGASKIFNTPVGAQLGQFLPDQIRYLNDLRQNSRKAIGRNVKTTLRSYQPSLRENDYNDLINSETVKPYLEALEAKSEDSGQPVRVLDPKGQVRLIPANQVDAAIKAGGKLAQ